MFKKLTPYHIELNTLTTPPPPPTLTTTMAETHKLHSIDLLPQTKEYKLLNDKAEELAKSIPTADMPSLDHLKMKDYALVYEPSDDTYLMLDALYWDFADSVQDNGGDTGENVTGTSSDENVTGSDDYGANKNKNKDEFRIKTTLELGCGTGVNTISLAMILQNNNQHQNQHQHQHQNNQQVKHIVTDINEHAIRITQQTALQNKLNIGTNGTTDNTTDNINNSIIETHLCDLATPLLETYKQQIDVLIFNPPYVPTPDEEVGSNGIEASWAGGTHGRVVLDRALPQIASLLSYPHGAAYVITVDDNKPEQIASFMKQQYNINVQPFVRRRARNEFLTVLKMTHII